MQDIWVSLHSIRSRSKDLWLHHRPIPDIITSTTTIEFFIRRTFQDLAGYPRLQGIVDLRPLRGQHAYKGLPEVGPARLIAAC
jgi:hypothetical protein